MCDQVSVELPGEARSAGEARAFVAEQCRAWRLDEILDDVTLPVSELVTNAVIHARTPLSLTVSLTSAFIEVSVRDRNARPPVARPVRLDLSADIDVAAARAPDLPEDPRDPLLHVGDSGSIAAGRGLLIVDAIADEWGVLQLAHGKEVWFRLCTPEGEWHPPHPCHCAEGTCTTPGGLRLNV
jgi:anti-sigma regulatory factor (Ser/Thr protein kinase)